MRTKTAYPRVKLLLAGLLGGACVTAATLPAQAQGDAHEKKFHFNIDAGPVSRALAAFSEVTGVQFVYPTTLVRGLNTEGISGEYTATSALDRLLANTGIQVRFTGATTATLIRVRNESTRMLGPVRVEGQDGSQINGINGSQDITATEGTNSYTSGALTIGGKTPHSIKDTPQSVSVITQQRMQDQGLTDFTGLMNQATGVSVVTASDPLAPTFYSRGFEVQRLQVDGGAPMDVSRGSADFSLVPQIDLAIYDHAELLRGADGLFNGYGDPGGVIALTRKRPLNHSQVILEGQLGSWNNYRSTVDATGPLTSDGSLRGRAVLAYQDQDYFYRTASSNKTLTYGVLEYDLFPATTLGAGFSVTRLDAVPFVNGLPRFESGKDLQLSRDTCICFSWNRHDFDTQEVFTRLEHSFDEDWTLKLNLTRTNQERSWKYGLGAGPVNPVTFAGPKMRTTMSDRASEQDAADLVLDGSLELLGHRQFLVAGANYANVDGAGNQSYTTIQASSDQPAINVFNFDPRAGMYYERASGLPSVQYPEFGTTQWGAYATLRLTFWEPLTMNVGVRHSNFEYGRVQQSLCSNLNGCTNSSTGGRYAPGEVTRTTSLRYGTHNTSWPPQWSLVYRLSDSLSIYGSYADIYQQQSRNVDHSGNPVDPITGSNVEGGIKWSGRDDQLNATLSVYRLEQDDFALFVDYGEYEGTSGDVGDGMHFCCYSNDSDRTQLSQGADLEITGELLPGWQIATGYTYNENEFVGLDTPSGNAGKPLVTYSPKHLFKLWSNYRFQEGEWLRRLSVGGGVNAQSDSYTSGSVCLAFDDTARCTGGTADFDFKQRSYAIFSARVAYQFDSSWSAALNINNLTDRTYYQTIGRSDSGNWYGEPRSFMLTVRGQW